MENSGILHVHGQRTTFLNEAAVCHVAAGGQASVQINDIANVDILQVFCGDRSGQNFLSVFDGQHYKVTPE